MLQSLLLISLLALIGNTFGFTDSLVTAGLTAAPYDEALFTPVEELNALSNSSSITLTHPLFPDYGVRIKRSHFCDGFVNAYTGYIDIEARHTFFYFFESRSDPVEDDIIFWTNGGPAASSSLGLFMELGPCRIISPNETIFNSYSWNSNANIFFVDQPVGVGFSYADYPNLVTTTEEAAADIAAFMFIFFENFIKFRGRAFHMAGESYGGRYIPLFASAVFDSNAQLIQAGLTPINLASIMLGNGATDMLTMFASYYDIQCTPASVTPFLDIKSCVRMKQAVPRCMERMKKFCLDQFDLIDCKAAYDFCTTEMSDPFDTTGRSSYDLSKKCEGEVKDTLCYSVTKDISAYLDRPEIRKLLGVDSSIGNFPVVSWDTNDAFDSNLDHMRPTVPYVANLLERGVRVLVYAGTFDFICNWVGNERWTLDMEWSGQEEFASQSLRAWLVDGNIVGKTRSAKGLTFVTVDGAGHMVPYDKPKEALELIRRWLGAQGI